MPDKKTCFIIRPFSEPFNKRSEAVYKPAIRAAGLEPVEAGVPGDDKITDEIENGIRNAAICLADLTPVAKRDRKNETFYQYNFNVWYELGFAFACHRRAVMLFNTDIWPMERLPFDIKHRFVKSYKNSADSDEDARNGVIYAITEDLRKKLKQIANSATQQSGERSHANIAGQDQVVPVKDKISSDIDSDEIANLSLDDHGSMILNVLLTEDCYMRPHQLKDRVFAGLPTHPSDTIYALALNKLRKAGMVLEDNVIFIEDLAAHVAGIAISDAGKLWCEKNQNMLLF